MKLGILERNPDTTRKRVVYLWGDSSAPIGCLANDNLW